MNRAAFLSAMTVAVALASAALSACGGADEPMCQHEFVGPIAGPDQSAQAHCLDATQPPGGSK